MLQVVSSHPGRDENQKWWFYPVLTNMFAQIVLLIIALMLENINCFVGVTEEDVGASCVVYYLKP